MNKTGKLLLILFVGLVVVLLFFQTPLMRNARGVAWSWFVHRVSIFLNVGAIRVEDDVVQQLAELSADNVRLQAELHDYQRLREQIGSPSYEGFNQIVAAVAGRPIDTFRSQYVISKGARDGVVLGAPIVINGSVMIGIVTDLNEDTAIFQLLVHPSTNITVEVIDDNLTTRGLVQGRQYTNVLLTTVPRDIELKEGQQVVTAGDGTLIPLGLSIGAIRRIQSEEQDVYQEASVQLPYNPDDLRAVYVMVPR